MNTETLQQLEEIRKRRARITEPPWILMPELCGPDGQAVYQQKTFGAICEVGDPYPRGENNPQENMVFIANAPTDIDFLLAELDKRAEEVERFKAEASRHDQRRTEMMTANAEMRRKLATARADVIEEVIAKVAHWGRPSDKLPPPRMTRNTAAGEVLAELEAMKFAPPISRVDCVTAFDAEIKRQAAFGMYPSEEDFRIALREASVAAPPSKRADQADVLVLLHECDRLLLEHHSASVANGWHGDCPVCSNTGKPNIFSRLSVALRQDTAEGKE